MEIAVVPVDTGLDVRRELHLEHVTWGQPAAVVIGLCAVEVGLSGFRAGLVRGRWRLAAREKARLSGILMSIAGAVWEQDGQTLEGRLCLRGRRVGGRKCAVDERSHRYGVRLARPVLCEAHGIARADRHGVREVGKEGAVVPVRRTIDL